MKLTVPAGLYDISNSMADDLDNLKRMGKELGGLLSVSYVV